ncbi:sulfurtransferase complex subunit TusD [Buchnera aphidicola]|uniref:Sulfur transfer complex subunit TusD n=1 Tax=Buchnera aphidicola str. Ua (Uroleucon ambrosiae) TaxID=1005057 RepID=G2LQ14_BUCUM|nr:sulfurtransferase complex subunit TusD [Buchnera aphidicola]AEO08301.1 sulfur transfer complex subunit TusD [Buchnera aphidicola str. Ua (Uroleucon ambrosiae)]
MNYTILVTGAAYGTQNASTAFLFCKSLIKTNHKILSVFFYGDGVLNANKMTKPALDEFNLVEGWQQLKKKYQIPLYVCHSSALRRGILKNEKSCNISCQIGNLAFFFQLSSLVELAYSIKLSDRFIQF